MMQAVGVAIIAAGVAISASTFGAAMKATRGEGHRKLAPLAPSYWIGLCLMLMGVWLQVGREPWTALAALVLR